MKKVPIDIVYSILSQEVVHYNVPIVDLIKIQTNDPEKVLVATILSARTKDQTTAAACKKLFARICGVMDIEQLNINEIEKIIYPVGFYKTKAKHLKQLPTALKEKFDGIIPHTVEELIQLPGVGRKTANLVVAVGFQKPGMCVDTHVHRITNRLGYVKTKTPYQTEMALRTKLPLKYWEKFNSMLVTFGQNTCTPVSPHCSRCPIEKHCNKANVTRSR